MASTAIRFVELLADSNATFNSFAPGFMHRKVMPIDDTAASVGTHNFDNRLFRLNFEIAAVVYDKEFNRAVEAMFENDFNHSTPIDPYGFAERPWRRYFGVELARLTAPIFSSLGSHRITS